MKAGRMKIALVTDKYPPDPGGVARSSERLGGLIAAAGHEVHVFALTANDVPGRHLTAMRAGVVVHRIGQNRRVDAANADLLDAVTAQHERTGFDVLHGYFVSTAGFVTVLAARMLGVPSIVSARGNDLDRAAMDPAKAAHVLFALTNATLVTANAGVLAKKAGALAPAQQVLLVPNGVDATLFSPGPPDAALRAELDVGDRPIVCFSGEARAKKGLATLLVAARELGKERPLALVLVGGVRGGSDTELVDVYRQQAGEPLVRVVPHVPPVNVVRFLRTADVVALPSVRDGLPNALLEAMACGAPVVGTTVGGFLDVVRSGENGWLVPPREPPALVRAIRTLLDDRALAARLGAAARAHVATSFTPERELATNLEAYARVLARPSGDPSSRS
jgi:glycosyltransferase involved in cell wall biosynthesis